MLVVQTGGLQGVERANTSRGRLWDILLTMNPNNPIELCPVCWERNILNSERCKDGRDAFRVECQLCGLYEISRTLAASAEASIPDGDRKYLAAHTRQQSEAGTPVLLSTGNWQAMADGHKGTRVAEKIEMLLQYVASKTKALGDGVEIHPNFDYPLMDGASPQECLEAIRHLQARGDFKQGRGTVCILTVQGWAHVQRTGLPGAQPGRVFIAMWFDESMQKPYVYGMKPAIEEDCRMVAVRVDKIHHNEKICDRILAEIRMAQCVVADVSGHRSGVYFEAGFAKGLGREVIWMCRDADFDDLQKHFDTRQFNHIRWSTPEDLRQQLAARIRATVMNC